MTTSAHYYDPVDGSEYPLTTPRWRSDAQRPLLITPSTGLRPEDIDTSTRSLWRYRAALPLHVSDPITLGEGCTPLVASVWEGSTALFKLEWFSPSGSFKDRGASVMLSVLREQGITAVIEDSSGNGGSAIAAYGAAGGLDVTVFAPASTSPAKLAQARAYGATMEAVEGPREASQQAAIAAADQGRGFYASHNWQAWFLEGTKSLAYELWEDLGFTVPDAIIVPVGAGSSLLGLSMGFGELLRAGQIHTLPRLYAAQPLNCSPIDAAFRAEQAGAQSEPRPVHPTVAEGTAIRNPLRMHQILAALRDSRGGTVTVTEERIIAAKQQLAAQGLFVEPTSATAAAALTTLRAEGSITTDETVVVLLTGSGLKGAAG
ncbi:pyridoxal-phosphate dependent enzyme [Leucobacter viscericola]|uniref:Pyridoxal-phosphate dependent enzyme n=1 Tax=Leucobacter viscericola TaxID=2714935 RepID=A0A6G7XGJ9_9MICO|nr:pyridoxal-phosphate dependent enzyme [Leucobacter viscericola]QIK63501.1 pyridoxal-phosphate dependent enzyme [Leucobacter viscericola]